MEISQADEKKTFTRVLRNCNMLQIHFSLWEVLWEHRIIKMSKVGTITMKLQGRNRKGNRRLMANSAKTSPPLSNLKKRN